FGARTAQVSRDLGSRRRGLLEPEGGPERAPSMNRRGLLTAASTFLAMPPRQSRAQHPKTVGILSWFNSAEDAGFRLVFFINELRRLGYEEGRSINFDYRFAAGNPALAKQHAEELVRRRIDVLVADPTPAAVAAKAATETIPIVFLSADPEASGL